MVGNTDTKADYYTCKENYSTENSNYNASGSTIRTMIYPLSAKKL